MENISLPIKVNYQGDSQNLNRGITTIEPCYPGYGNTWGNALRRVLLSSLPGAAVTAIKIRGVKYEFSTIENIKEDVLDIILNLKSLRLKILSESEEPIRLTLKASGEKKVIAKDIDATSEVKIVNPDLLIATLTDKKASLEMDIWVKKGYGWVPSEEKSREGLDLGVIVIDSLFNPVVKIGFNVENVRFGKRTDYDRIILDIETDSTVTPLEAFNNAVQILSDQFDFILKETNGLDTVKTAKKSKSAKTVKVTKKTKTIKKENKPKNKPKTIAKKAVKKASVKKSAVKK